MNKRNNVLKKIISAICFFFAGAFWVFSVYGYVAPNLIIALLLVIIGIISIRRLT